MASLSRADSAPRRHATHLALLPLLPLPAMLGVGVALMLTVSPLARAVPGRDSGVYLYVASVIMDGGLLYRDVWDHKPPGVYYLDALGLALGGRSLWGVWVIQTLFVLAAIALGFAVMKKALGSIPAIFGSIAWVATLGLLLIWENYPEEYALPLQFGSLFLFYEAARLPQASWRRIFAFVLIGMLAGGCFLLKPTLVGTQLAVVLLLCPGLLSRGGRVSCTADLAAMCAGGLVALSPVTAHLGLQGVLDEAVDAVFRYGVLYSAASPMDRFLSVLSGLGGLPALSGAPTLALIAWAGIGRRALLTYKCRRTTKPQPINGVNCSSTVDGCQRPDLRDGPNLLSRVALIALPVELLLVEVSGRNYGYYYTAWLPTIGILCALFAHSFICAGNGRIAAARVGCLCALLPVMIGVPAAAVVSRVNTPISTAVTRVEAVRYIAAHTSAADSVLIWGAEPGVNFAAKRRSPTRYVYQYPLYTRGYADVTLVKEFLGGIEADPPTLIIDASSSDRITPPIDKRSWQEWAPVLVYDIHPEIRDMFEDTSEYVGSHYQRVDSVGPDRWSVYARKMPEMNCR